jgi:hypothetical protein
MGIATIPATSSAPLPYGATALVASGFAVNGDVTFAQTFAAGKYIVVIASSNDVPQSYTTGYYAGNPISYLAITTNSGTQLMNGGGTQNVLNLTATETSINIYQKSKSVSIVSPTIGNLNNYWWFGSGYWVSQANTNIVVTSDGLNYSFPVGASTNLNAIPIFQSPDGYWVAGTTGGTQLWYSNNNALSWTNNGAFPSALGAIGHGSTPSIKWVGGTSSVTNQIQYSTNGVAWTSVALGTTNNWSTTTATVLSVIYGNNWVVVGYNSTGPVSIAASSTDGITWATRVIPNITYLNQVSYTNGFYVAGGSSTSVVYSTDGTTWASAAVGLGANVNRLHPVGNTMYAYSSSGKYSTSTVW